MRVLIVVFFLFAGIDAHAQGSILSALLETTPITSRAAIHQKMDGFIQELQAKKFESKNDVKILPSFNGQVKIFYESSNLISTPLIY